jgi:hypothetical protein
MPGPSDIPVGNVANIMLLQATLTPLIVATITTAEQTFTVPGLIVGDFVLVQKPTAQAGLGIVGSRVSAANTLAITFDNPTAAGITPTAGEIYIILLVRRENPGINGLPKAFV